MDRKGADEGGGLKPRLLQPRRRRLRPGRQPVAAVVADAVLKRIRAGQDAGVRAQRRHCVRMLEREADAAAGEPIERRRRRRAAIRPERIGAQGVDGDQQNVLVDDRTEIGLRGLATAR